MAKHQHNPIRHNKNREKNLQGYFESQKEVFRHYLTENIATASMVSSQTGIPQKNLTRYKAELEEKGLLKVLFRTKCRYTGFDADYLTTNPDIIASMKGGEV